MPNKYYRVCNNVRARVSLSQQELIIRVKLKPRATKTNASNRNIAWIDPVDFGELDDRAEGLSFSGSIFLRGMGPAEFNRQFGGELMVTPLEGEPRKKKRQRS